MMAQTYADGAISRSDPIPDTGLDTTERDGRHQAMIGQSLAILTSYWSKVSDSSS